MKHHDSTHQIHAVGGLLVESVLRDCDRVTMNFSRPLELTRWVQPVDALPFSTSQAIVNVPKSRSCHSNEAECSCRREPIKLRKSLNDVGLRPLRCHRHAVIGPELFWQLAALATIMYRLDALPTGQRQSLERSCARVLRTPRAQNPEFRSSPSLRSVANTWHIAR
jgi:hypothetical protein